MTETEFESLRAKVEENNSMLKRVCAWIDRVESPQYKDEKDQRAFFYNVLADVLIETLSNRNNHIR